MKREGINTLSIRSYLRALNCLAHFINFFLCVFEKLKSSFVFEMAIAQYNTVEELT